MAAQPGIDADAAAAAIGALSLEKQAQLEEEHRISEIKSMTLLDMEARPDAGGTQGRKIPVSSNLFTMHLRGFDTAKKTAVPDVTIYHYDVQIDPHRDDVREVALSGEAARIRNERKLPITLLRQVFKLGFSDAVTDAGNPITAKDVAAMAFDGRRNVYLAHKLKFTGKHQNHEWIIALPGREAAPGDVNAPRDSHRKFKIKMSLVNTIDASTLLKFIQADPMVVRASSIAIPEIVTNAIQALQVLVCHDPSEKYKVHGSGGRRFFTEAFKTDVPDGASIWKGFFQSIRACQAGLVINIDASFAAFLQSGNLLSVCSAILGRDGGGGGGRGGRGGMRGGGFDRGGRGGPRGRGGPPQGFGGGGGGAPPLTQLRPMEAQQLRRRLKNAKLRVTHRQSNKLETFKSFSARSCRDESFSMKDGTTTSIVAYFQKQYGYKIKYPELPCVMLGSRALVPMECLELVPGTALPPLKLTPEITAAMIDVSRQRPNERCMTVTNWRKELQFEGSARLKAWGVDVATQPLSVDARVLNPPQVVYGKGSGRVDVRAGGWNLRNAKFVMPGRPLICWAIINFTRTPDQVVQGFAQTLQRHLQSLGMAITKPAYYARANPDPMGCKQVFEETGRAAKKAAGGQAAPPPQLFVCLIDGSADLYGAIKRACFTELPSPVASQCLLARKALNERGQDQYCANVGMKINVKLNGSNHAVDSTQDLPGIGPQTMLVGADVSHAAPGSTQLSIAASVATIDGKRTKYHSELRAQRHVRGGKSQEAIVDMKDMAVQHLNNWAKANGGTLPSSIIVFRDGVSEGQWYMARQEEAKAWKEAIASIKPGTDIPMTYIVCMKRHHVRFFPQKDADADRSGNLPAGMVVDTKVVHPYGFDFYLQSHAGLIGTARPTRYVVLQNEGKFNSDQLQRSINSLCYTYCRATRAVSLVPPAYYADILAERGRALMYSGDMSETATSLSDNTVSALQREAELPEPDSMQLMRSLNRGQDFTTSQWYM